MRKIFYITFALLFTSLGWASFQHPQVIYAFLAVTLLFALGVHHIVQKKRAILRNFPLIGMVRYLFENIRPELRQYFFESEIDGAPIAREARSLIYQRAKLETETLPFGTQRNVYETGYEWLNHSLSTMPVDLASLRVVVGGPQCTQPYSASIFNISAMSYGSLSSNAILALNGGARLGNFYHNTGEGGVSKHHFVHGGDLVWQIGTGYFGSRDSQGNFCADTYRKMAVHPQIKMIELKLSQGAKPSHGGILPAAKITAEIASIRKVAMGQDVISPPAHKAFSTPKELLQFIKLLRDGSGGKPTGFKICIGHRHEFIAICKAMIELNILPDFITIDGGEGGTGAAPQEFSNSVGSPLEEALSFVHDTLIGFGLRSQIRIIAAGKVMNGFNIFAKLAMGADICNSARAMLLAIGCIQARKCNTNKCPTGVATSDPSLTYGLDPEDKKVRVFNFHKNTLFAFSELLGAAGLEKSNHISRHHVSRRISPEVVKNYAELFPYVMRDSFLKNDLPAKYAADFEKADANSFLPIRKIRASEIKAA